MDITLTSLEKEHSELLKAKIASEITSQGGWIPFSRYMEMALYEPGMGYYSAGAHKLGSGGDFTTAPELSPLFGAAICSTLIPVLDGLRANGLPTQILEFGAGTGKLATSILTRLQDLGFVLDRYDILEISPALFRKRLQLARESVVTFMRSHCGLVSDEAPCRCHRRHRARRSRHASSRPNTLALR